MSSSPAQTFVCPSCRTQHDVATNFCPECGTDMTAPPVDKDKADKATTERATGQHKTLGERRLSDSNRAWLGKIVDNRYRVLDVIGRGGMGVVYRVEHLRMGKVAAMKVLHRDLLDDAEIEQRFEREAAAVSRLHHPHTVQVFDFGNAHGALYLIMEYVRGLDLAHIIERDGPMPWARAAPLFAQIAGALQEAHELGVVHRDLKPENVLITRTTGGRDFAKVLDFGLAKLDQRDKPKQATDRQQIVGTPYFMAPEQIRGDDVDARTDIYSFGALMFNVLTGQHVYSGTTAVGVLTKHLTNDADAPSIRAPKQGIDPKVDHLVRKALARDPAKRWQTATALVEAIEEVYSETVETTSPGKQVAKRLTATRLMLEDSGSTDVRLRRSDLDQFERSISRRRVFGWLASVVVLAGAAAGAGWYVTREQPPLVEEREPNDDIAHANKIAVNTPVTGYIGKRQTMAEGDTDTYMIPWPSASKRIVTVRVSSIHNVDLNLAMSDGDGLHNASVDEGGIAEGEVLHRREIDGTLVIHVGETVSRDQKSPVENVSDPYTLVVTEDRPDGETEPNDLVADANELKPTYEMHGYLDTRKDVDVLRFVGPDGTYSVVVRGDGIPMAWRVNDSPARTPGAAKLELHQGDVIRLERTDRDGKGSLPGRDQLWSIVVTR